MERCLKGREIQYLGLKALTAIAQGEPDEALRFAARASGLSDGADARFSSQLASAIAHRMKGGDEQSFRESIVRLSGNAQMRRCLIR